MVSKALDFSCTTAYLAKWDHLGTWGRDLEEGLSDPLLREAWKKGEAMGLVGGCSEKGVVSNSCSFCVPVDWGCLPLWDAGNGEFSSPVSFHFRYTPYV